MLQEFRESFLFVRDRPDDQRRLQLQNFSYGVHVPAIAEFWQSVYRRDIRAPFRHADEMFLRADGAKNGGRAWRERNDAKLAPANCFFHSTDEDSKAGARHVLLMGPIDSMHGVWDFACVFRGGNLCV